MESKIQLTLPRDLCIIKNMVRNVHAVLVEPGFIYVTLSHFVTFFLGQETGAVKVYRLGVSDTSTPLFTCYWKVGKATILQTAKCCLIDL